MDALTGTTVIRAEGDGAVGGVDVRGSAPGTRETDLMEPINQVENVNAVVLSGGSSNTAINALGDAAADTFARAIVHAVVNAESAAGFAAYCDEFPSRCRAE